MSTKPYIGGLFIFTFLIMFPLLTINAAYNGECWVVSNGDTIYKLDSADALMDPNGITIPDVSQVQTAEVDPKRAWSGLVLALLILSFVMIRLWVILNQSPVLTARIEHQLIQVMALFGLVG